MKKKIGFSIVMPVYNGEKNLIPTVESLLAQSYHIFELVIIDDYSKDNSYKILKSFSQKDKRIRLFKNKKNRGVSFSRDFGIKKSKFDWIVNVDSDIIAPTNWLSFASNKAGKYEIFGGPVKYNFPKKGYLKKASFYLESNLFPKKEILYNKNSNYSEPAIGGANLFIKKRVYFLLGGFDKEIKIGEDRLLVCEGLKRNFSVLYDPKIAVGHPLYDYYSISNFLKRSVFFTRWKNIIFKKNSLLEEPYKRVYYALAVLFLLTILAFFGHVEIVLTMFLVFIVFYSIKISFIDKIPAKYILGYLFLNFLRKTTSSWVYLLKLKPVVGDWKER